MTLISNLGIEVDFEIVSGTDFSATLTLLNPDTTPINLSGSTFAADIKKSTVSPVVEQAMTVTMTDAVNGVLKVSLPHASNTLQAGATATDPEGQYVWDLKMTDSGGNVSHPRYGTVTIWSGVTP